MSADDLSLGQEATSWAGLRDDAEGPPPPPEPVQLPPTRAGEFTAAQTGHWSDERLDHAVIECLDDPQALDALEKLIDARQHRQEQERLALEQAEAAARTWEQRDPWARSEEPELVPWRRQESRLTPDQRLRAEYETFVDTQWLQAEADCNGVLLNDRGRAEGMDARSLFAGSVARATRYASEELQSWWGAHGRLSFAAFRYQAYGRESDRGAAERARHSQSFDDAVTW